MNQGSTAQTSRHETIFLISLAAFPLCIFLWMAMSHAQKPVVLDLAGKNAFSAEQAGLLGQNMDSWDHLSWDMKENAVAMAIRFFRETSNIAIMKSPQHYVVLMNQLFKTSPEAKMQNIFVVLKTLAIQEYDFLNGINADEQARQLLGPELFEANKKFQKARETEFLK